MDTRSPLAHSLKTVCASALITGAILGAGIPSASAQSIATYTDKTINRLCTNQCIQGGEEIVVDSVGNATAIWGELIGSSTVNVLASRFSASSGLWEAPRIIASGKDYGDIGVGIDGKGRYDAASSHVEPRRLASLLLTAASQVVFRSGAILTYSSVER